MPEVKVTELRQNLPDYLAEVRKGKELKITVRGKVIARIVPEKDVKNAARQRLVALRTKCKVLSRIKKSRAEAALFHSGPSCV